jgi:2-dehydro-3-deoxyphosphooctonate aldolase (KDO 8-P synthase)
MQDEWQLLNFTIGLKKPFFLIAGPCVIESEKLALETATFLKELTSKLGINFIYKSSFDKANRSSEESFRGIGIDKGLRILADIKYNLRVPILTDVHEESQIDQVAAVVDILQTPAFLCRQTNFIQAVAKTGKAMNIKKGQFLAPSDMQYVTAKALSISGHGLIMACERGVSFGYNNLISDMTSLITMRETNCPVVFDATHSLQLPGGLGASSGGRSEFIPALARAAIAVGISGLFIETHPNPAIALSDGPNSLNMFELEALLTQLLAIDSIAKA